MGVKVNPSVYECFSGLLTFQNREALTSAFERSFHDWDKRQLHVFLVSNPRMTIEMRQLIPALQEQGLVLLDQNQPSSGWTLKTPKEQEAVCFTVLTSESQPRKHPLTNKS